MKAQWSKRAQELLDKYATGTVNVAYLRKAAERQAKEDESPAVYRTHMLYVLESMKH